MNAVQGFFGLLLYKNVEEFYWLVRSFFFKEGVIASNPIILTKKIM